MPKNVEIKASVKDLDHLRALAKALSESDGELIQQEDTFFVCPNGRLKLRELKGSPAQLIFYQRQNQSGPKVSDFQYTIVPDPESLKKTLGASLGVRGVVKKDRWLYLVGQTRIHCDQVEALGTFMELEVELRDGQNAEEGEAIANDLMKKLEIDPSDLIKVAYMDLILGEEKTTRNGMTT